jgi:LemA protein
MEILIISLAALGASALITFGWIAGGFNTLKGGKQNIKTMLSNIKTEYQRRADLLYNLAESVKSYAKFEKGTLKEVIAMRSGKIGTSQKELADCKDKLDGFLSKLMLVVERYPNLKANEQYKELMKEVRITEDRINIARTEYNNTVRDYNLFVVSFPSNILARMFNHQEEGYFKNEEGTDKCPKLDLSV